MSLVHRRHPTSRVSRPDPSGHEPLRPVVEHEVTLEGRGTTLVRDFPGPPGAATLLLLHGLGATAETNWRPCFEPLGARFRVLSVDLRGHGRGLRTSNFRLEQCADDAAAIVEARGIERAIAVGWSMGGMIASLLWQRHRARVAGLVLCATGRHFVAPPIARVVRVAYPAVAGLARLAPGVAREGLIRRSTAVLPSLKSSSESRARVRQELSGHDPRTLVSAVRALSAFSAHDWIGSVDVPTACVVTTRDGLVPPARQRRLAKAIANAEVFEIDGDHSACNAQADRFVPALIEACRSVEHRLEPPAVHRNERRQTRRTDISTSFRPAPTCNSPGSSNSCGTPRCFDGARMSNSIGSP